MSKHLIDQRHDDTAAQALATFNERLCTEQLITRLHLTAHWKDLSEEARSLITEARAATATAYTAFCAAQLDFNYRRARKAYHRLDTTTRRTLLTEIINE